MNGDQLKNIGAGMFFLGLVIGAISFNNKSGYDKRTYAMVGNLIFILIAGGISIHLYGHYKKGESPLSI